MRFGSSCNRTDFVATLDTDAAARLSPGHAPARRTREGYLEVDALIARDGLLKYSDGRDSWTEYRPREELERAAASWTGKPVTDDHPDKMVDATTWASVAKGVHVGQPTLEVYDGVTYLRARLQITDADLIRKIDAGQRELSIGFTAAVEPVAGGQHSDGTRCDAVQMGLVGNHTASVRKGRAGPACRVLLDSAHSFCEELMTVKNDEAGQPADMLPVLGPDGVEVLLPSWVVAALDKLKKLEGSAPGEGEAPAPEADAAGAAPAPLPGASPSPPSAPAVDPALVAAVAAALRGQEPSRDSLHAVRRRVDRLAVQLGAADEKFDSLSLSEQAREVLRRRGVKADGYSDEQLAALIDVESQRAPAETVAPWQVTKPLETKTDAADDVVSEFLKQQGF